MHSMLIETESTPNPATLKFLPGQAVMEAGTRDFASPEEAEASPLASALFSRMVSERMLGLSPPFSPAALLPAAATPAIANAAGVCA